MELLRQYALLGMLFGACFLTLNAAEAFAYGLSRHPSAATATLLLTPCRPYVTPPWPYPRIHRLLSFGPVTIPL